MEFYPAIDLRDGRCVRLAQGAYDAETVYGDDPVAVARQFVAEGARWIHVVDLDAARTGEPVNRGVVAAIASLDVHVESGGGVRSVEAATTLWEAGVARVVVGTAAAERPGLVASLARLRPGQVAVGIDTRGGEVAVRGWQEGSGLASADVLARTTGPGVGAVIVTDIGRDGMLSGPDLDGLTAVLRATDLPVIASGGVSSVADLVALASLTAGGRRLEGAIVGRALYEGRLTVAEGVAACAASV